MTSKISLVKQGRQSAKYNLAIAALMELIYFCSMPLAFLMGLHGWKKGYLYLGKLELEAQIYRNVQEYLGYNPFVLILACLCGVLLGVWQFKYLHNSEQVDFYHSLPVKREQFFGVQYLTGCCQWFGIMIINQLLALVVAAAEGFMNGGIFILTMKLILMQSVAFLITYSFMILAMMLTGKILVALLGMAVFCLYGPGISLLREGLCEIFLTSYSTDYASLDSFLTVSPVGCIFQIFNNYAMGKADLSWLLGVFLIAILVTAVSLLLYRRRDSEASGRAMAFPVLARMIKLFLVIPLAIVAGLVFYSMMGGEGVWMAVGAGFGFLLFSALIEFIYCMDIREVFQDKKQMLLTLVLIAAILGSFRMDLIGYDKNIPGQTEIERLEIGTGMYLSSITNTYVDTIYRTDDMGGVYQYIDMKNLGLYVVPSEKIPEIYDLLAKRLDRNQLLEKNQEFQNGENESVNIAFHLKNGTVKARTYWVSEENLNEMFDSWWEDEDFRNTVVRVLDLPEENVEALEVSVDAKYSVLEGEKKKEGFEIFQREWEELSIQEIRSGSFEGKVVSVEIIYRDEDGVKHGKEFYLPDSFEKTREYLMKQK